MRLWTRISIIGLAVLLLCGYASLRESKADNRDELATAAANGEVSKVKSLLNKPVNENQRATAVFAAATGDKLEVVKLLVAGDEMKKMLKHKGAEHLIRMAVIFAVLRGNREMLALLLNKGANVDGRIFISGKGDNWTPLMLACQEGKQALAKDLLDRGANVNAKNSRGETPLALAQKKNHHSVVKLLKDRGAKP